VKSRDLLRAFVAASAVAIGAIAVACSSFSGDEQATPEAGADASTNDDGSGSVDGAVPDAPAPSCIPLPLEGSDAGEDASCGPGGLTVDLAQSTTHCGRCGHDCLGGGCQGGRCVPANITTESGLPSLGSVVAGRLYYAVAGASSQLRSVNADGTDAKTHLDIGADAGPLTAPEVAGTDAYAIARDVGILKVDTAAAVPTNAPPFYARYNALTDLAVGDTYVYWLDYTGGIAARPRMPGTSDLPIRAGDGDSVFGLWSADAKLYWALTRVAAPDDTMLQVRSADGSIVNRATNLPPIHALAFDADYIYMASRTGVILRVEKAGAAPPVVIAQLPGTRLYPKGFAVDDDSVYVAVTDDSSGGTIQLTIFQASKCGGPTRRLVDDFIRGRGLASIGRYLYWSRENAIGRVAK
jgi:hypothetical protein